MKRLCIVLAAALLLSALTVTPAAADDDWVLDALDTVLEKTILLSEAGAFSADPVLETFVDEYGWGFGPDERIELLDELYWYDDYGADSVSFAPPDASPEAIAALQLLDASTKSILDANSQTAFLDHNAYLDAISDLLIRRGAAPAGARDPAERDILEAFVVDYANSEYFNLNAYAGPPPAPTTTTTVPPTTVATTTVAPTTVAPTTVATTATTVAPTTATTVATTRVDRTTRVTQTTQTTLVVDEAPGAQGGAAGDNTLPEDSTNPGDESGVGAGGGDDSPSSTTTDAPAVPSSLPFDAGADGELAGSGSIGSEAGGSSAMSLTSARVGLVLALLAALVLFARRRGRSGGGPAQLLGIAEVSSKLAGCNTRDEVTQTAVVEAVRLAGADAGAYYQVTPDGLHLINTSDASVFSVEALSTGALQQVAKHARPIHSVVERDPAFGDGSVAIVATPVLDEDQLIGVLTVARDASSPFEGDAAESAAAMAQLFGSALHKTRELESALEGSEVDWLTSLPNRRKFDRDVSDIGSQAELVGVAMVDIDHFKGFNDTYGHDTGDAVLKAVAEAMARNVRPVDMAYRYGGEEFSVLLRGCELDEAAAVMERVRVGIQQMVLPETPGVRLEGGTTVTVSVGVAAGRVDELPNLLRMADQAMYAAKHGGRNRVVVATPARND